MSFWTSCSWRLMVLVETTTRVLFRMAKRMAGKRYATDLPMPVPPFHQQMVLIIVLGLGRWIEGARYRLGHRHLLGTGLVAWKAGA